MNEFLVRLKKIAQKYREWVVIVVLLAAIVYFLVRYQGLTAEQIRQEILGRPVPATAEEESLHYDTIVNSIMGEPAPYVDLVKHNPFVNIETTREMRRRLQEQYDNGRRLFNAGDFYDAKEQFLQVLQQDSFEVLGDYKPYKPSIYVRLCEQEAKKREIGSLYTKAVETFQRAQALEVPGAASDDELLRTYEECERSLTTVLEQGEGLLPEAVEDSKAKMDIVKKRVGELRVATFNTTLARLYEEAVQSWNRREEGLTHLADAKEDLDRAKEMMTAYPGELSEQAAQIRDQIDQLSVELSREVDRRYPIAWEEAEQLERSGEGNLEQLSQAQKMFRDLYRLRGEEAAKTKDEQLDVVLKDLRAKELLAQAQGWVEEARQTFEKANQALGQGDYAALDELKQHGLTVLGQLEALSHESAALEKLRADGANLRSQFEALQVLPPIQDVVLRRATGERAVVFIKSSNLQRFLGLGQLDPVSGLTFTRVGKTEGGGRITSVYLKKDGFRETEVPLEQP